MHFLEAARAVVAHAGHDDAQGVGAGEFGDRAEQHVNRGLVSIDQRPVGNFDHVLCAVALEHHVLAAGGDQRAARVYPVAVLCFADFNLA